MRTAPDRIARRRRARRRLMFVAGCVAMVAVALVIAHKSGVDRGAVDAVLNEGRTTLTGPKTLPERLAEIGPAATARLEERFALSGVPWPPTRVALLAFKDQKVLELQAQQDGGAWRAVHRYPVLAASGGAGPKLVEGDRQVPEGHYRVTFLNPNSRFHVSLRLDYPNAFDRDMGRRDGRPKLGGDIMIHGGRASIGCLAVGDPAVEELFALTARVGLDNVTVVIAPADSRGSGVLALPPLASPAWVAGLYADIDKSLEAFPVAN